MLETDRLESGSCYFGRVDGLPTQDLGWPVYQATQEVSWDPMCWAVSLPFPLMQVPDGADVRMGRWLGGTGFGGWVDYPSLGASALGAQAYRAGRHHSVRGIRRPCKTKCFSLAF